MIFNFQTLSWNFGIIQFMTISFSFLLEIFLTLFLWFEMRKLWQCGTYVFDNEFPYFYHQSYNVVSVNNVVKNGFLKSEHTWMQPNTRIRKKSCSEKCFCLNLPPPHSFFTTWTSTIVLLIAMSLPIETKISFFPWHKRNKKHLMRLLVSE